MILTWLVWFEENSAASPESTLKVAVQRYIDRFGLPPNRVRLPLVWPEMQIKDTFIERCRSILPRHVHLTFDPSLRKEA